MRSCGLWLLFVLAVLLMMPSCRSSRNLDSHVDIISKEEMRRLVRSMDSLRANVYLLIRESNERLTNLKLENKTICYSIPDSTGRQYPTVVSETKSESSEKESSRTETELYARVDMLSAKIDNMTVKLDEVLNRKDKIVELSWWDRHKDKVYIGFALIIVGWLVYKSQKK